MEKNDTLSSIRENINLIEENTARMASALERIAAVLTEMNTHKPKQAIKGTRITASVPSLDDLCLAEVMGHIYDCPGMDADQICRTLRMAKKTFLSILRRCPHLWYATGTGVKGDPLLYFSTDDSNGVTQGAA